MNKAKAWRNPGTNMKKAPCKACREHPFALPKHHGMRHVSQGCASAHRPKRWTPSSSQREVRAYRPMGASGIARVAAVAVGLLLQVLPATPLNSAPSAPLFGARGHCSSRVAARHGVCTGLCRPGDERLPNQIVPQSLIWGPVPPRHTAVRSALPGAGGIDAPTSKPPLTEATTLRPSQTSYLEADDVYGKLFRGTETLFRLCERKVVSAGKFHEGG